MAEPGPETRFLSPNRPRAGGEFFKAHGLGNDYLVVEAGDGWRLTPDAVERVCHRTLGVGSDGVIWVHPDASDSGGPFASRMFNPDGSEFERSGNGLRILAAHLHRTGRVAAKPFSVSVGGETVTMEVLGAAGGRYDVAVEMGQARVGPAAVGLRADRFLPDSGAAIPAQGVFECDAGPVRLVPISVGNPHAVLWGAPDPWPWTDLAEAGAVADLERFGPVVATDPAFAAGTNVQLARVESHTRLHALVWERGAGRTSASGTSACAVAVSAVASGRIPPGEVEVVMEGGTLRVRVGSELEVRLRGPVEEVMEGRILPGLVPGQLSGPHPG